MEATHITSNSRSGKLGTINEDDNDDDDDGDDDDDDDDDDDVIRSNTQNVSFALKLTLILTAYYHRNSNFELIYNSIMIITYNYSDNNNDK